MKVQDLATRVGITPHTVRYYNKLGLPSAQRDPANRYRRFGVEALERLRCVRRAVVGIAVLALTGPSARRAADRTSSRASA